MRLNVIVLTVSLIGLWPALCCAESFMRGIVRDGAGRGIAGVFVRCFQAGKMIQEVSSGGDGAYELRFQDPQAIDLIWYDRQGFMPRVLEEVVVSKEHRIDLVMRRRSESFTLAGGLAQIHSFETLGYYFLGNRDLPYYSLVSAYEGDVSLLNVPSSLRARLPPLMAMYSSMKESDKQGVPPPIGASSKTGFWVIPPGL